MSSTNETALLQSFALAAQVLRGDGKQVTPGAIVFRAIEEAFETLKRLPDPEFGWLYSMRSLWPEVKQDRKDQERAYAAMLDRIKSGEENPEVLLGRKFPSPAAVTRMDAIFDEIPKHLVGTNRRRDWQIVSCCARGMAGPVIARVAKCSRTTVSDRKSLQSNAVAAALDHLMPQQSTDRSKSIGKNAA